MSDVAQPSIPNGGRRLLRSGIAILRVGLTVTGAMTLVAAAMFGCTRKTLYATETIGSVSSPGRRLRVIGEVTRGGLGTVWTTRLYVGDLAGRRALVYANHDSDYVPGVRWTAPERLTIRIHCGRIDHLSNPAAYAEADDPLGRLRVRFAYDAGRCARAPAGDE